VHQGRSKRDGARDGSGLTQLTQTQGIVQHADGSIDVEMPEVFIPVKVR